MGGGCCPAIPHLLCLTEAPLVSVDPWEAERTMAHDTAQLIVPRKKPFLQRICQEQLLQANALTKLPTKSHTHKRRTQKAPPKA